MTIWNDRSLIKRHPLDIYHRKITRTNRLEMIFFRRTMRTSFMVLCNTEDNVSILFEFYPTIRDNEDRCGYYIIAYDIPFVGQTIAIARRWKYPRIQFINDTLRNILLCISTIFSLYELFSM